MSLVLINLWFNPHCKHRNVTPVSSALFRADGFRLVEWPDRAPELVNEADIALTLEYAGDSRNASMRGLSARGASLIQKIN